MIPERIAVVDTTRCVACGACENACSNGAAKVYSFYAKIDAEICVGCGECLGVCPIFCIGMKEKK